MTNTYWKASMQLSAAGHEKVMRNSTRASLTRMAFDLALLKLICPANMFVQVP